MSKEAVTDHPVHELIARRWSPYGFSDRPVSKEDLRSLFEAARWAASSFNEQPWRYIVATKDEPENFERMMSCLMEANQGWAVNAPALVLGVAGLKLSRNDRPNRAAIHDLGLAAANLTFEATARGLYVHQMVGMLPDKARKAYRIPEGHEAVTAMAIGYAAEADALPEKLKERDSAPRQRKPLAEFVFGGQWGEAADLLT